MSRNLLEASAAVIKWRWPSPKSAPNKAFSLSFRKAADILNQFWEAKIDWSKTNETKPNQEEQRPSTDLGAEAQPVLYAIVFPSKLNISGLGVLLDTPVEVMAKDA